MASPILIDCEQRTDAWFQARAGVLTATAAADVLAKPLKNGGEPACRRDLRVRLALERLAGGPVEEPGYVSPEMKRGTELEPAALAAYEAATGTLVQPVGFIRHATLPIGCSPDGVIGNLEGGVELKCPKSATHVGYLKSKGKAPAEYIPQLTHTLYVTGAPWWDFVSFDPRLPEPIQLFRVRFYADDVALRVYGEQVEAFLAEVDIEQQAISTLIAEATEGR